MTILYESKYQQIIFYPEVSLLENIWYPKSASMNDQEYQAEMYQLSTFFKTHLPEKQLIDTLYFLFPISPDLQHWTDENILKPHSKSTRLKKVALLMSTEIFSQVSIEQTMEEPHGRLFNTRYFDDKDSARAWLN